MHFEKEFLYHIYNQGNNKRRIYFNKGNYLFFIKKIRKYILPYADILAWCLMPNHFHFMLFVRETEIEVINSEAMPQSHRLTKTTKKRSLNDSIAIMLRSYTRAINKQNEFTGSLFRNKTKADCINYPKGIMPSFINESGVTRINIDHVENQYPQICFNYIHQNPVKAGLVSKDIDWDYSSAQDYAGLREGKLVNKHLAKELRLFK